MVFQIRKDEQAIFKLLSETSKELGFPTYVVGGYVRDRLLARPSKDMDIVCLGSGIQLALGLASKLSPRPKVAVYKRFGTAMLRYGDLEIEFVGARKESYRSDSRKPTIENGTLEDDQNRRDFTINALAVSLNEDRTYGQILDSFNGLHHLEERKIVTPLEPSKTFSDDPLRMMRAIRFSSQLNFIIDPKTLEAIGKNKHRIKIVSKERISTELNKIILSPIPSVGFKLLFDTGLLEIIFPEMAKLYGVEFINGRGHKDNFYHTLEVLDNISRKTDDLWLRWAAILHDIAKPPTKRYEKDHGWTFHGHEALGAKFVPRIFRYMKLPMDQKMKFVQKLVYLHLRPIALTQEKITDSAVRRLLFEAGDDIDALMLLCEADITSKNPKKVQRYLKNYEKLRLKIVEIEEKDRLRYWQPPISGEIIMATFGIKPSRPVGIIKNAIKEAILDGDIQNDYDEAFAFMLEKGKTLKLSPVAKG
jgi:putative nucleotidyltransferase with HDIG domain